MRPEPGRRLHVSSLKGAAPGTSVELSAAAQQHARVLRLSDGAALELFDGLGHLANAEYAGSRARLHSVEHFAEPRPRLGLIQGLPKGAKSDDIVRMATELGAATIVFTAMDHSAARLDKIEKKAERWARIALEAARQSERLYLPQVRLADSLHDALAMVPEDAARFVCLARDSAATIAATEPRSEPHDRWVCVGPEGGLSEDERLQLAGAGFRPLRLGRHILRVDTAASAALTLIAR